MRSIYFLPIIISALIFIKNQANAQNETEQKSPEAVTRSPDSKAPSDETKNPTVKEDEGKGSTPPVQSIPNASNPSETVVESQRGCRVQIKGLQNATKNSIIRIKEANGGSIEAKFISTIKNFTIANVAGDNCKKKLKGLSAELVADPETLPLQLTTTTVHQPQSSGWHRSKRPDSWTFGLGAGLRMQVPVYRIELGRSGSQLSAISAFEYGQAGDSSLELGFLTFSGELQFHLGNSFYMSGGWCSETAAGIFTPVNTFDGKIKKTPDYLAAYKSKFQKIHYGIGNRWQWGGLSLGVEWIGFRGTVTREDEVLITNFTTETIGEGMLGLNKNYIAENTPADIRFLMTRLLYSF